MSRSAHSPSSHPMSDASRRSRQSREQRLVRLGEDMHELTGKVETHTRIQRQRVEGRWQSAEPHNTRLPSLIVQLELLRGVAATPPGEGSQAQAESRTPPGSSSVEVLADIDAGVRALIVEIQEATDVVRRRQSRRRYHRGPHDMLGYDARLGYYPSASPPTTQPLRTLKTADLLRLAAHLARVTTDEKLCERICGQVHHWTTTCRLALSYLAEMVTLEAPCPYCNRQSLITRADASSAVFCSTDGCLDDNGATPRWPRGTWLVFIDRVNDK